jgi:hypothetical protein
MGSHSERGELKGKFCTVAADGKCGCSLNQDYIENAKAKISWAGWTFPRYKSDTGKFEKKFEAHHVLCVASVTSVVSADTDIEEIIRETQWCVNSAKNMLAMPIWGHYVKWYCYQEIYNVANPDNPKNDPPPFSDIPAHDWDHNKKVGGYRSEVNDELKAILNRIKKKKKDHEITPQQIKKALDDASDDFADILESRGARKPSGAKAKGTNAAWQLGCKDPDSAWYMPFSMASDPTAKGFPLRNFDEKKAKWVKRMVSALNGGS